MQTIKTFLDSLSAGKEFTEISLALLSASAVLRKEKMFKSILLILKEKKFPGRKIYEALLQTYLFSGYPSAIISLSIYSEYFNAKKNYYEEWDIPLFKERGEKNCRKIYGSKFEKLVNNINSFSGDLSDWFVTEGYGKVLGRKGLSLKEREVCNIAVLSALKFESQLYSHINGGYRLGLNIREIEKIIDSLSLLNTDDCVKFGKKVLQSFIKRNED